MERLNPVNPLVSDSELQKIADRRRLDVLNMIYTAKTGHIGGSMSELDILTTLFYRIMDIDAIKKGTVSRDHFVLSKGHSSEAYYSILADLGFFPKEELKTYAQFGTRLMCHPSRKIPGVEMGTGALGHGVCVAVGIALGMKRLGAEGRVFVIMGDGEQAEGSVWEAAMAASHYKLDNLYLIVDRNHLQISGSTEDVMALEPLAEKYRAFGCEVETIDGHNYSEITQALTRKTDGKPIAVIANTIKGKGLSWMQGNAAWHHKVPNEEQYHLGIKEIKERLGEENE